MISFSTLRDVDVNDKVVLVRTDFNVPLEYNPDTKTVSIVSDFRIRASLPTIEYLLKHQAAKIVLISHLGRPEEKPDQKLSLKIVAQRLTELLSKVPVRFASDVAGPEVEMAVDNLPEGGILLLENLRFSPEETAGSADFAREIIDSTHAELFVQDGFAVTHRAHASTVALAEALPSCAGLLLEKEVTTLTNAISDPEHPFVVVIGGAKVADKQPLIERFLSSADRILIGGKIAADGYCPDNPKVYVAEDFDEASDGAKLDIGPVATSKFVEALQCAQLVLWNGVLGKVEDPAYATASTIIAKVIGENKKLESIICGGDTTGFVENLLAEDPDLHFSLLSTGGGAALSLLSGEKMPGIEALAA